MEMACIGFLAGMIVAFLSFAVVMIGDGADEETERPARPVTKEEMMLVLENMSTFGRPTPYEKTVLQALMELLERSGE